MLPQSHATHCRGPGVGTAGGQSEAGATGLRSIFPWRVQNQRLGRASKLRSPQNTVICEGWPSVEQNHKTIVSPRVLRPESFKTSRQGTKPARRQAICLKHVVRLGDQKDWAWWPSGIAACWLWCAGRRYGLLPRVFGLGTSLGIDVC